jgi:hypothetical protein
VDRETTEAGVVNSLNDAIPAFLSHYEKYPLRWDRVNNSYWKFTLFVILRVEQDQQDHCWPIVIIFPCFKMVRRRALLRVPTPNKPPTRTS